eukprot:c19513_g2_i2.p1 GENE.c19513_g2_i2~~c19513_g2_i2.p1  ORF type:complete len:496 (+),score=159.94 c19513_g2_i2:40-1488(+)
MSNNDEVELQTRASKTNEEKDEKNVVNLNPNNSMETTDQIHNAIQKLQLDLEGLGSDGNKISFVSSNGNSQPLSHHSVDSDQDSPDKDHSLKSKSAHNMDTGESAPKYRNRTTSVTGETIFKDHPSHDIMLNIKLGVRYSTGNQTARTKRELTLADFQFEQAKFFPSSGSADTPTHRSSDFKFKDYAPTAFRHIRGRFHIDEADYMLSIGGEGALKELPTPGKSGSLFYKTVDDKFLIKTISKQETVYFRDILAQYYNHVMQYHDTLLPRFFQLFQIKTNRGRKIRMVVMHNILPSYLKITERFDLKGSTFGRITTDEGRGKASVTLKDLDFLEMGKKIVLGTQKKQRLMRQLALDCNFLQNSKLMDYSLLVGVKHLTPELAKARYEQETQFSDRTAASRSMSPPPSFCLYSFDGALDATNEEDKPILVYCGIIDILQEYSMKKQIENLFKGARFDKRTISAVAPDQYAQRFSDYMKSRVFF